MNKSSARSQHRAGEPSETTRNGHELFTGIQPTQLEFGGKLAARGSHDDARQIRTTLAEAIRKSGKSRAQIADEMTFLSGRRVTERMLNGYTAESQEDYQFPAELTRAFCAATGDTELNRCFLSEDDVELLRLGRAFLQRTNADEQIALLQRRLGGRQL